MMQPRLLVVEDDQGVAALLARGAKRAGYDVAIASNADIFITLMEGFRPDVITLDILMPEMDGFDILRYLHACHSQAHIILISGSNDYAGMAERMGFAQGLSIVANIGKPFRMPEIIKLMQGLREQVTAGKRVGDAA